ncbi:hypothetical protein PybrP1_001542, partial [[Pythium] brassicae (nom. inval.)]
VREKGVLIDVEALGLEDKVNDVAFLNDIQGGVNKWIKEIQKVTRLISEPLPGTAIQEINFWCDLNRALVGAHEKLSSPEVEITLALLKRAKRYLATVTFSADHGLGPALQRVASVMALMKDFPMHSILSATDLAQLSQGVTLVFTHMKKIRVADEYKLARLLHLVEIMSSDLAQQVVSVLRAYSLMQLPFERFEQLIGASKELFANWHRQVGALYDLTKELAKRRGAMTSDKPPQLAELQMEHAALEERLLELHEFREQHETLRQVIERVLGGGAGAASDARSSDVTGDALAEINAAYVQLGALDALDVSVEGTTAWRNLRKSYELCIDRVEGRIIASLTSRLSATTTADEMFRVFAKYNALFFRPRIRSAVQQFQMQLIENVKQDVGRLQAKFRAHYAFSEAARTSKLRDIPPIAGAVMWAKQIERKLQMLLARVESVLGSGWEQHVEGKALKVAADAFVAKLNPQLIFDQWVSELASMPIFDIKNIVLNIVTEDGPHGERKTLVVAFNQQIVTLFKEVRNLEWLGYRVPFTLKMIAEDAKSKYPFAMSLDASLKTYTTACRRVQPIFEPLVASYVREVRATIGKTFSKGNEMRWHADGLGEYVTDLAAKVERLHDKVEELLQTSSDIDTLLETVRSSADFSALEVRGVLAKVQSLVDELSLAGYANLNVFVKNLNTLICGLLATKLAARLRSWVACFDPALDDKSVAGVLAAAGVAPRTHQILLKNQVLYLEPSVDDARSVWVAELQALLNSVCDLPKLQTSSYENVYGKSTVSAFPSPSRKSATAKRRDAMFREALAQLPPALLPRAYRVVDATIDAVQRYAATWLQYQALWDMDAQAAINAVGEDLDKWQQILLAIKTERNGFDAVFHTKRFGPVEVNYQQVQAQVNVKYDAWHNEFLAHFGDLLGHQIHAFYVTISSKRTLLEQHALEAATAQVVAAITLIQDMRVHRAPWQTAVASFAQGERLLKKQRFKFAADWPSLANVEGEWEAFVQLLERKSAAMESQLPQLQAKILEEKAALDKKIVATVGEWDAAKPLQGGQAPKAALELLLVYDTRFKLLRTDQEKTAAALEALSVSFVPGGAGSVPLRDERLGGGGGGSSSSPLTRAIEELAGLDEVWTSIATVYARVEELQETLWSAAQPRKVRKQLEDVLDEMRRFPARVQQYEAFEHFTRAVQAKKAMNALLAELKSDAIRDRHWKQILRLLRITSPFTELTLRSFWDAVGLSLAGDSELKQLIRTAQGELALDEFLRQVTDFWANYQLDLVNYQNRCRLIRGWDEMFAKLEEHLNSLSSMKQSPYYRVFAEQAASWEEKLTKIRGILDFWIDVQRRWVYLEGIFFGSADIKVQLPKEFARFQSIDSEFTATMKRVAHKPVLVEVANVPNLLHALERQQEMMGNVQRALGEYLERQRAAFPRFYFVGDEDLLEMIGNSKEPRQIQRHLSKMFAGVAALEIDDDNDSGGGGAPSTVIRGMVSREGEVVRFRQPVTPQDDPRINVWLGKVEEQMRQSLSQLLDDAIRASATASAASAASEADIAPYLAWVAAFPAQVVLLATQVQWSRAVEAALAAGGQDLPLVLHQLDALLRILSARVLSDVTNDVRKKYEQLITELVHQKSVTKRLVHAEVRRADDFRWLYHMRYYFDAAETDPLQKLRIRALETKALLGSISDTILPKLVAHDVPVFATLLTGVFPGTDTHRIAEDGLRAQVVALATQRKLVPHAAWVEKALQLYQVMQLRHGVMLVGPSGTGKSAAWRVLLDALEQTPHVVEHHLQLIRDLDVATVSSSFALQPSETETMRASAHAYVALVRELIARGDGVPSVVELCLEHALALRHIMDVTRLQLLMSMFSLLARGLTRIHEYNEAHADFPMSAAQLAQFAPKWLVFALIWGFGGSMDAANRVQLCAFVAQTLANRVAFPVSAASMASASSADNSLLEYEVNLDDGEWRPWSRSIPQLDLESHRVLSTDVVVTTVDTVRHVEVLRGWLSQHRPLILCGPPGSGKTMTLTSTLSSLPEFEFASLNFSSGTSPELILKTFAQYCEYKRTPHGMVLAPNAPEKWLVVFCDEINLPEADRYGTQRVITFLRQLLEQGGFWLGGKNAWVRLQRIQFVGACNPPTDPGRVPLSLRLLRHAPVLLVDFPSYPSLKQIYGTFNRALLKLTPSLRSYAQPLTDAMVDVYSKNQARFTAELQPHYIYSPRELSRWTRALYEAIEPLEYELELEALVKLVFHEALRLFMDRLVTPDEQRWCFELCRETLRAHFPQSATSFEAIAFGGAHPVLFSTWLSKHYAQVAPRELRKHIEARLRVFYEEELNVPLVVFDSVLDHVLRIDRVLRQPLGHLLLVGESGAGKTVLSRFVSWMNGIAVFQIKLTAHYTLANFDDDLRVVLKRCGCDGEKICFIFDESNALGAAFLERMNALLASGEVPGLFEDDEYASLMHACREAVQRDGVMVENTEDELFRYFTKQVQRNLHVVFTMNPAAGDFQSRSNTSPALFNRCVVDWFGTWNDHALAQVAYEFTNSLDLPSPSPTGGAESVAVASRDAAAVLAQLVPHSVATGTFRDVLVASIVQFHHAVLSHMRRLQKRHLKHNHLSPRDYLEFIRHFVALYAEKRAQLEDQQLHLNVGVQKLQATRAQVAALQAQLSLKERELKQKDVEANEKLQQMIREQNAAQAKKQDTEQLAADLATKDDEISSRKRVAEADLAQAEPALLEAQASVNSIRKSQLDEIRALARPPVAVRLAVEAVAVMLGETSLEWADLRRFIRRDDFIASVVNFDSQKLTARQRHTIQTNYIDNAEDFEYDKVNRASKACGPLYKWVVSQISYTTILHKIQPLRDEVAALVETSAGLRRSYEAAKRTIDALEVRIESYKHEYAALISEAQVITSDMASVNKKVERSVALLNNLLHESARWEAGANDFDAQMQTLVGDTLLCAAFLTYAGFLDFQQRKILAQDWRDILAAMGVATRPQLSFTSQAIAQTSFLDSSFMKVLASAIRFGTALLVHEVERIDPILNPVLNRELYKTGGRVLIRLGGEEIDYSPDFRLFLITRDPSCRFSPDICSRVTFVNFTVTPSSLESQGLSLLMKREQPAVEEKRANLLKLQGEYQAKLRELEDALLQQINNVQGNILDDDSVIHALEGMKAEAAHISAQVAQTQTTMRVVEAATSRYRPLAKAASRLFFALEALSSIHFLYQYSLGFFLSLLSKVLTLPTPAPASQDARLASLSAALFHHTAARVSRGLAESDKLMFALRLTQIYLELEQETAAAAAAAAGVQSTDAPFDGPVEDELDLLLGSASTFLRPDVDSARSELAQLLPAFAAAELEQLLKLVQVPSFKHVESHVREHAADWNAFMRHPAAEQCLPDGWDATLVNSSVTPRRAAFRDVVLVLFLRPDRVMFAAERYVALVFGPEFPWRGAIELQKNIESDTQATRAVLLSSRPGFDASAQIDELALALQKKYSSVSMGSAEGFDAAEKGLNTALKSGTWLLLRNVHLCPSWLVGVEKKLYNARDAVHPGFRLFLTSEIHPSLPVNLLRMCDLFVFEPPSGMKLSMIRTLDTVAAERMDRGPAERARLYLLLAWFHALVHERLRYVPVGWSKTYEFSQSDFRGACDVLDRWVDSVGRGRAHVAPDHIPWAAIRTTLKESVYGGRVDNEFDQELMDTLLAHVFTPESYQHTFELVSGVGGGDALVIAEGKTKQQFMDWIQRLPSTNPPSWMGLPRSAETMVLISQGSRTLRNLQLMQDLYGSESDSAGADEESAMVLGSATGAASSSSNGGGGGGDDDDSMGDGGDARPKWVQDLDQRVDVWLALFPSALPAMSRDPANLSNPIYRCMFRELELGAMYLASVTGLLATIKAVCAYTTKPTNDTREAMQTLHREKLPSQWAQLYRVSSELTLSEWLADFARRIHQLGALATIAPEQLLQTPGGIWLGGLFSPEAFVTAARQSVAAALACSLDELELVAEIAASGHVGSFGVRGLQLEGASWGAAAAGAILPSDTIRNPLPLLHLRWSPAQALAHGDEALRRLPVYANDKRDHLLFSVLVQADSASFPTTQWIQRSIALVLWQLAV